MSTAIVPSLGTVNVSQSAIQEAEAQASKAIARRLALASVTAALLPANVTTARALPASRNEAAGAACYSDADGLVKAALTVGDSRDKRRALSTLKSGAAYLSPKAAAKLFLADLTDAEVAYVEPPTAPTAPVAAAPVKASK